MQTSADFWDNAAEKYAKSPISDMESYEYTLGRTRTYLSPSDKILEIGCGTGSTALLLAGDVDQIVASDISRKMIGIAAEKALEQGIKNVNFIAADLFETKSDDCPYDAVLALNLLHLIEDPAAAIRHVRGLLKPGGIFISKTVCQPGKGAPLKFRVMKLLIPLMQLMGKAPFVKFMKPQAFEDLVAAQGFKILESGDHPLPSRYIVAKKV